MSWPLAIRPNSVRWQLVGNTIAQRSPLDGTVQTLGRPGAAWMAVLTLANRTHAEMRALEAFIDNLEGAAGRFDLWHHGNEQVRGAETLVPLVNGASQVGKSLVVDGMTPDLNGALLAGDLFGVNGELKRITADVDVDAGGNATLAFTPALRSSPGDNAPLVLVRPTCRMGLIDDAQGRFDYSRSLISTSISCVERFL